MGAGKKILIIFISILLVLSLIISATLLTTNELLHEDIYLEAINESEISEFIENSTDEIPGGEFIEIPEEEIEKITENFLTNFLSYIRGDSEELNLTIEINSSSLMKFFEEEAEKFPVCLEDEEPYPNGTEPVCRPQNQTTSEFLEEFLEMNNITLSEEESINLAEIYGLEENPEFEEIRSNVSKFKPILFGFLGLVIILSLSIFFISKNYSKGTINIGINFAIAGTIILMLSIIPISFLNSISLEIELIQNFILNIANALLSKYRLYGGIILGVGAITIGIPTFIKIKGKKSLNTQNP